MTSLDLNTTEGVSQFLKHYWQQKPVVLRQLFPNFEDPIDEHDLAGLAQEDDIDSRIIQNQGGIWDVVHGPFEEFEHVCKGQWTLLVQGVDKYIDEVGALIEPFRFIPNWRMDDVMVSFATTGAGVGAHLDQYDVFLVQGKGSRRWRVGEKGHYDDVFPHPELRQISGFTPIIDEVLLPGDVLYIPPGWPHDGVTIEDCLTYSVGFRAPDISTLANILSQTLAQECELPRFADPARPLISHPCEMSYNEVESLKTMLKKAIDSELFTTSLIEMLSEQGLPDFIPEGEITLNDIEAALENGASCYPSPGNRPILAKDSVDGVFFVNGETFAFEHDDLEAVTTLLNTNNFSLSQLSKKPSLAFLKTLTTLVNKGYWDIQH